MPAREPPVGVRGEINHLVHDGVAGPRALLSRRAVDVAVHRTDGDRAPADCVDRIEARIAALEIRFASDRIQALADADGVHGRAGWRIDRDATAAVEIERFADSVCAVTD